MLGCVRMTRSCRWHLSANLLVCCLTGENIIAATGPTDYNFFRNYDILTGRSFSAVHVAGIAALLRQKYPAWSPATIKSAMVTTGRTPEANGASLGSPRSVGGGEVGHGCCFACTRVRLVQKALSDKCSGGNCNMAAAAKAVISYHFCTVRTAAHCSAARRPRSNRQQ